NQFLASGSFQTARPNTQAGYPVSQVSGKTTSCAPNEAASAMYSIANCKDRERSSITAGRWKMHAVTSVEAEVLFRSVFLFTAVSFILPLLSQFFIKSWLSILMYVVMIAYPFIFCGCNVDFSNQQSSKVMN